MVVVSAPCFRQLSCSATIKKVVVNNVYVVIASSKLTTACYPVVIKLTTGNYTWSLILLTVGPLTTMDDHIFMVVNNI
jgi:hypothetical protein